MTIIKAHKIIKLNENWNYKHNLIQNISKY